MRLPFYRRLVGIILLGFLLGGVGLRFGVGPAELSPKVATETKPAAPPAGPIPKTAADVSSARPAGTPESQPAVPAGQRAFRFTLDGDALTLDAIEGLRGDFRRRRRPPVWAPGRLCCRLLDVERRVLAEVTLPAPDHTCMVLDAHVPDLEGQPSPVSYAAPGPVVFQVCLPQREGAVQLLVYRLATALPPAVNEEPVGKLLATIPLQP